MKPTKINFKKLAATSINPKKSRYSKERTNLLHLRSNCKKYNIQIFQYDHIQKLLLINRQYLCINHF